MTNAKGSLTRVTTGSVSNPFSVTDYQSFDVLGRITQSQQTTDGNVYNPMTYIYDLAGNLLEEKYPSGRVVKTVLDENGDLSMVRSKKTGTAGFWNYADSFTYNAAGAATSVQLGNGRWESTQFNSRLQPIKIALGTTANATNLLHLDYSYGTTQNNGNIQSQTIHVPDTKGGTGFHRESRRIPYDSLNRLISAAETIDLIKAGHRRFRTTATATGHSMKRLPPRLQEIAGCLPISPCARPTGRSRTPRSRAAITGSSRTRTATMSMTIPSMLRAP